MINILSNLIDKLFALPGFILAIIELKKYISSSDVKEPAYTQKTTPVPTVLSSDDDITIDNRKTIFTIYYSLSLILSIGFVVASIYFNHDSIPLRTSADFSVLQTISVYFLFGCYKLSNFFIYVLLGTSAFAMTLHVRKQRKNPFIETGIFLCFLFSAFFLSGFAFPPNYEHIYKFLAVPISDNTVHSVLIRLIPFFLVIEPAILFVSIIQIAHMLYIPKNNSPYLRVRIKTTLSLFLVPLLLVLSTSYWAFL